jgi:hypothetical protein
MKKLTVISDFYTVEIVRKNPNTIYVYGDNLMRVGRGGQAIIRDEPNAFGIVTKKLPNMTLHSFFEDTDFDVFKKQVLLDIEKIQRSPLEDIVFPSAGIGTGLARLPQTSPMCWNFLCKKLLEEFGFNNQV